ncbi:aryl-alcohol dehydrogenase AAD14 [Polychaeton citri CBS 116435]|uniref:Aryl-alcohol dehydrogenase AAD14 n=1 Tax=Polychaeton citri CBS 116435 TaxID=1314669 RepID=A0A9P4PVX6_9PEZI|nr:aryl-alcohol dehydrogenase AAD14 [Polychaeton citri CBS 116435]
MSQIYQPAPDPPTPLGRYRILSSTAGIRVSPFVLGGLTFGEAWSGVLGAMTQATAFELLDAYVAGGGNFIDTASNYQDEQSERWIGEWLTLHPGLRDRIVLATKYSSDYTAHRLGKGKSPNSCGNHRRSLHMSVRASLAKLQTDWIDVLYVHYWDWTTSIEEVMDALHILVLRGEVLYLGASDMPAWVVAAANTYARAYGKTPFSIYQGRWNILRRDLEREIVPMARQFGMAILAWDVMGGGHFKTESEMIEKKELGLRSIMSDATQSKDEKSISDALEKVASELGVESITTVALAYILAKAPNVFPLVGARTMAQLKASICALDVRLTPAQMAYLESVRPLDLGFPLDVIGSDPRETGVAQPLLGATASLEFVKYPVRTGY